MVLQKKETDQRKKIQLLFLLAAGMVPFFAVLTEIFFPGAGYYLALEYMAVPGLLFFGAALTQRLTPSAKWSLLLSFGAVGWFVLVQMQHNLSSHMGTRNFGLFAVPYLLAFPFAAVTEDGERSVGLKWIGRLYLGFSSLMVGLTMLLYLEAVPEVLASSVYWDGVRARIFWHPNGSACVLLLGIGFSLYFLTRAEKKWEKWVMAILTVLQFLTMVLTNSRTTILLACAMMAGTVFFVIWKETWKQFLAAAAAALAVIAILLGAYNVLSDLHNEVQLNKVLELYEADEMGDTQNILYDEETGDITIYGSNSSSQGELTADMRTLNGRTGIWAAAFEVLRDIPSMKIWGTEYVEAEVSYRNAFPVINCHNAWIQMMMLMGIPGLLVAVVYTLIAVWNLLLVMFRKNEDLSRKVVAMMVVCLLAASILEVYLFTGEDLSNCENFLFFLLTGYLIQWNRKRSETK